MGAKSPGGLIATHLWAGREFCRRVLQAGLGNATGVYTFNSAGLEILEHARANGLFAIMEQTIAPAEVEDELLVAEGAIFPGWEKPRVRDSYRREFQEREHAEWASADLIVCGSEFVREGIRKCGGPVDRCRIVPYGVTTSLAPIRQRSKDQPLRVLTVGAVNLRKGAPYALAAAKMLGSAAQFRMVGPATLPPAARARLAEHIEVVGPVPRPGISAHYAWADVFLLPSICEGSATVCYEALAAGLPVITTPNAGSVVRDGVDGFVVRIRDPEAIAERLLGLARDRKALAAMSDCAVARAAEFTVREYGRRLLGAVRARSEPEENDGQESAGDGTVAPGCARGQLY
jgi:glycosyltransferase involved in cell wall biosynthesis